MVGENKIDTDDSSDESPVEGMIVDTSSSEPISTEVTEPNSGAVATDANATETSIDEVAPESNSSSTPSEEKEAVDFDESEILGDDYVDEDEDDDEDAAPLEDLVEPEEEAADIEMDWYILKVQVNRENSICEALRRNASRAGMEHFFGDILVPSEDVKEFSKSGKQRIVKRKLYPGYIVVRMAINDDTWFLVRETSGIGDFTGAVGKPTALTKEEIDRIVASTLPDPESQSDDTVKTAIKFKVGDRVRVKEGYFQNYEGDVSKIDERNGRVTVMINIFGRPNPVELDHWQVEDV